MPLFPSLPYNSTISEIAILLDVAFFSNLLLSADLPLEMLQQPQAVH